MSTYILLDTSTLMLSHWSIAWQGSVSRLMKLTQTEVLVPINVVHELQKHERSSDISKANKAKTALIWLQRKIDENIVSIVADHGDEALYADHILVSAICRICVKHSLIIIVQDEALARDLLFVEHMQSFRKRSLSICRVNKYGQLDSWRLDAQNPFASLSVERNAREQVLKLPSDEALTMKITNSMLYFLKRCGLVKG